jgi:hypothetical protein
MSLRASIAISIRERADGGMAYRSPARGRAYHPAIVGGAALALLALPACRRAEPPAPPAAPFGPIRAIQEIRQDAATLAGQVVRVRGRLTALRDLNAGMPFPWDIVYTVEDGTGSVPVHWFTQEQSPKGRRPPVLAGNVVIVTGKVKQNVELEGQAYPLLIHELAELHNQEHPTLPVAPTGR